MPKPSDDPWQQLFDTDMRMIAPMACCPEEKTAHERDALMLVADDGFVFGLLVFLWSFLKHNKDTFVGDILICHSENWVPLSSDHRKVLVTAFAAASECLHIDAGRIKLVFHFVDDAPFPCRRYDDESHPLVEKGKRRLNFIC